MAVISLVLTFPASSAEVEGGFSQLKILKSVIRATLSEERLNELLIVKLLSADIQNVCLPLSCGTPQLSGQDTPSSRTEQVRESLQRLFYMWLLITTTVYCTPQKRNTI